MALRAPPHRHAAGGRRARPRRARRVQHGARVTRPERYLSRRRRPRPRRTLRRSGTERGEREGVETRRKKYRAQPRGPEDGAGARRVRGAARRPARDLDWNLPRGRVRLSPLRRERRGTNVDGRRRAGGDDPPKRRKRKRNETEETETKKNPEATDYPFVSSRDAPRELDSGTARGRARRRAPCVREATIAAASTARAAPSPSRAGAGSAAGAGDAGGCRRARAGSNPLRRRELPRTKFAT